MSNENTEIVVDRSLVYESKISVASVAIGSCFPISLENLSEHSLGWQSPGQRGILYRLGMPTGARL